MNPTLFWLAIGFVVTILFGSFFEWTLHRYIMHRPVGKFTYPFERHAMTHHRIFKADPTYHLIHEEDKHTIPMAWWNGPALIAVGLIPFIVTSFFVGGWALVGGAALASCGYYAAYEYMHW